MPTGSWDRLDQNQEYRIHSRSLACVAGPPKTQAIACTLYDAYSQEAEIESGAGTPTQALQPEEWVYQATAQALVQMPSPNGVFLRKISFNILELLYNVVLSTGKKNHRHLFSLTFLYVKEPPYGVICV